MKFAGEILADLAGGETLRRGGVLGIGAVEVVREQFSVDKALTRVAHALEKLDIGAVANLWVSDRQFFEGGDGETGQLTQIMDDNWSELAAAHDGGALSLMLVHDDADFAHRLTIRYFVEHDAADPGFVVNDSAVVIEALRSPDESDEEYRARVEDLWDDEDAAAEYEEALEEFLDRLADELRKELAFSDVDVFVNLVSRQLDPELAMEFPAGGSYAPYIGGFHLPS